MERGVRCVFARATSHSLSRAWNWISNDAFDIQFHARLSEWEVALAKTHLTPLSIQLCHKIGEHTFKIAEGNTLPNHQALHLVEHRLGAGCDLFIAIALARQDDADRLG